MNSVRDQVWFIIDGFDEMWNSIQDVISYHVEHDVRAALVLVDPMKILEGKL